MAYKFKGGVHPLSYKNLVENKDIEDYLGSHYLYLPLKQHIGEVLEPKIHVGDEVKMGQKIGDSTSLMSVPIHSPVSGKLIKVGLLDGIKTLVIENDFKNTKEFYEPILNYEGFSKEDLITIIRERGIVGLGGATFPTHIKLTSKEDIAINTIIINASECEPYLNNDNLLIQNFSKELLEGSKILKYITGAKKVIIGIENNKPLAIEALRKELLDKSDFSLAILKTKYPQGGEKQLIKAVTGKELPLKKLPSFFGLLVSNVQTIISVYNGVIRGEPLIKKLITVSGKGVKNPKNLMVNIGTPFHEILQFADFDSQITKRLVVGGPMMGFSKDSTEHPVTKATTGLLALTEKELRREEQEPCISCGKCVDVCPMNLVPLFYERNLETNNFEKNIEDNLFACIECGACTYICPSNRPLNEAIRKGKIELQKKK